MADFKYSKPSIQNLFCVIRNSTSQAKMVNIGVIAVHYCFLLFGANVFLVAMMFSFCYTLFILMSPNQDLKYHYWIFFVVGPGLLTFGFILLVQGISFIWKNFVRRKNSFMGKQNKDSLGDRMKSNFEDRTRIMLPRRTYTILRLDGKAFHTYVKGLQKPFDEPLIEDMDSTAAFLCKNIMGAKLAYVQSDEISIVLTDFETISTEAWFDNNLQKMASVSASMATAKFNELRFKRGITKLAMFDSRVFQIPDKIEVENYFIWRYRDCVKNSISMSAHHYYSPKELHQKNSDEKQELLFQKGVNWSKYPEGFKNGRVIVKETYEKESPDNENPIVLRTRWASYPFDKKFLDIIPNY